MSDQLDQESVARRQRSLRWFVQEIYSTTGVEGLQLALILSALSQLLLLFPALSERFLVLIVILVLL